MHVANTAPGFEAGSTEVSQMHEENAAVAAAAARSDDCEMVSRPAAAAGEPREAAMTLNLPLQRQP